LWIAASTPWTPTNPERRTVWKPQTEKPSHPKGDLKYHAAGDKVPGRWVLVRIRHDRNGGATAPVG